MKRAGIIVLTLVAATLLLAAPVRWQPFTITQPDGVSYDVFASGDEFFNYLHDADGFTIIPDRETGWYCYAEQNGDELAPSQWRVGEVEPSLTGLEPNTLISREAYLARRDAMQSGYRDETRIPDTGDVNNLVIYIRFADQSEFELTREFYDQKFNDDSPGANSMYNYYQEVSYGDLYLTSEHFPPCEMTTNLSWQDSHDRSYFQPYSATNTNGYSGDIERREREHQLLVDAVNGISDLIPDTLNIDGDSDGLVDNVCFIIRGGNDAWAELLWAHRWVLWTYNVFIHGARVYDYTFQPETQNSVGTLCHEMFHSLGAPDLYHYNGGAYTPVGPWDLMDGGDAHMGAYMKYRYASWIDDIPTITTSGYYELNSLLDSDNNCYRIDSPNSSTEYFVLEYRRADTGTFEQTLPASGLVIYRIDSTLHGQGNASGPPDEVYAFRPGGSSTTNGSPAQAAFSYESGRTEFNYDTNTSCMLSNDTDGGIFIHQVGECGDTIGFILDPQMGFCQGVVETDDPEADLTQATITMEDQSFHPMTSGSYNIAYLEGTYNLAATLQGFSTDIQTVTIPAGEYAEANFYLQSLEAPANLGFTLDDPIGATVPCTLNWDFPDNVLGFENFKVYINVFGYYTNIASPTEPTYEMNLQNTRDYQFYVSAEYENGESDSSNVINITFTDVDPSGDTPAVTRLHGASPNPFNPETSISYELAKPGLVTLDIYDVRGRRVNRIVEAHEEAGAHRALWRGRSSDGNPAASGVYFYRLKIDGQTVDTRKMLLLK